jgi:hypothetical protein
MKEELYNVKMYIELLKEARNSVTEPFGFEMTLLSLSSGSYEILSCLR